jgi:hypothetical protein
MWKFLVFLCIGLAAGAQARPLSHGHGGGLAVLPALETPGPWLPFYNLHPYYNCNSNYYVSTTGNSGNNGLSPGTPWDILTAAAQSLPAGSCVNVAAGLYTLTPATYGVGVNFTHGGTTASVNGYVAWRCGVMSAGFVNGVLTGEGTGCQIYAPSAGGLAASAAYLIFDGFEIYSNNTYPGGSVSVWGWSNFTGGSGFTPSLAGSLHHVMLLNSDIHDYSGACVVIWSQDWQWILHNVWHDCASGVSGNSANAGSGMSLFGPIGTASYSPTTQDQMWHSATSSLQYRIIIDYNVMYHNYNPVWNFLGGISGSTLTVTSAINGGKLPAGTSAFGPGVYIDGPGVAYGTHITAGSGPYTIAPSPQTIAPGTTFTSGSNTDGEGLILDNLAHQQEGCSGFGGVCPYDGNILVMGNLAYNNGGSGIQYFQSIGAPTMNATFTNNTMYSNKWNIGNAAFRYGGELLILDAYRGTFINNLMQTVALSNSCNQYFLVDTTVTFTCPVMLEVSGGGTFPAPQNVAQNNFSFYSTTAGGAAALAQTYPATGPGANSQLTDPLMTTLVPNSSTGQNFTLQGTSPAIGFGQAFDLWQQHGTVDAGACPFSSPGPIAHCP